ncbi:unnamed protein product [Lactuca virosa]|uniref:Pentatricopeptide repeat-containing protein n=1 Tax=Lactuca virosa TaxID=75947 RepID=A0AAU9LMC5_9ASTR|nr:unnamed protein product [Lactuca virosa]
MGKLEILQKLYGVFRRFKARNVVTWTLILSILTECEWPEDALILFYNMQHGDVVPDETTFSVMLNASAVLFSVKLGNTFHALVEKNGFKGHKNVEDGLMIMYLRTGDIKAAAKHVFRYDDDLSS